MNGQSYFRNKYGQATDNCILDDLVEVNNLQELQELAAEEGIEINEEKWKSLVEETKQDINKLVQPQKKKYLYDFNGKLLGVYDSTKEIAKQLKIAPEQVNTYTRKKQPFYKQKVVIRTEPLTNAKAKPKFIYSVDFKLVGIYSSPKEAEEQIGVHANIITKYADEGRIYYKKNLMFSNTPIQENG